MACTLLLSSHSTIKPMDSHLYHQLKNGVIIVSAAAFLIGAGYGIFRTLNYFFPPKNTGKPKGSQKIASITAKGDIVVSQKGIDGNDMEIGDITGNGTVVLSQKGSSGNQKMGSVVSSGNVCINMTLDGNDNSTEKLNSPFKVIEGTDTSKTIQLDLSAQQIHDIYAWGQGSIMFSQVNDREKESVSVTAPKIIIDKLEISVDEKGSLRIGPKENCVIESTDHPIYWVNLKNIKRMYLRDMIKVMLTRKITAQSLTLNLTGQARIMTHGGSINVDSLVATGSGRTSFDLQGCASKQGIYLSGNAYYSTTDARSHYAHIEATGMSIININIEDQDEMPGNIHGFIAGASKLAYKGKPDISHLECKDLATIGLTIY